jgi:hypothetical protein
MMREAASLESSPKKWKAVYTIVERNGKSFWIRIGTAFVNRDQSLTVRLDAQPCNGQLHIRESNYPSRDGESFSPKPRDNDAFPSARRDEDDVFPPPRESDPFSSNARRSSDDIGRIS